MLLMIDSAAASLWHPDQTRGKDMHGYYSGIEQIDAQALAERMAIADQPVQLIDVREPQEVEIAALPNFIILPLSEYAEWADKVFTELDPTVETIVMCHHGLRSAQMCQWLQRQGFENVKNLAGGIDAYACAVDPTLPRY